VRKGNSLVGRMRRGSVSSALSIGSSISEIEGNAGMGSGLVSEMTSGGGGLSSAGSSGRVPSAGATTTGQHR
jgi:hypothetical protein